MIKLRYQHKMKTRYPIFLLLLFHIFPTHALNTYWYSKPEVIQNGLNNNTVYSICEDKEGFIWVSTDKGISRYDGFRFRNYPLIMEIDSHLLPLHQATKKLVETSDGLFYIQLYQGGITCFDKEKEEYIPMVFNRPLNLRDISDFCYVNDKLYLATTQGLFRASATYMEKEEGDLISCVMEKQPLVNGNIKHLCSDGKENLYMSIDEKEVTRLHLPSQSTTLLYKCNAVNRLFLENGYLWITRLRNDMVCLDLETNKKQVISMGVADKIDSYDSYVTDLVCRNRNTYYLTTFGGLFRLRFEKDDLCESPYTLTRLTQPEISFYSNVENRMTSVHWDPKQEILWTSTFGGGIVKFDVSNRIYSRVQQEFPYKINGVVEDTEGYIWITTNDGKIMKSTSPSLSANTRFKEWQKSPSVSGFHHIYIDKNGFIWLGNNRGEIISIHPQSDKIAFFPLQTDEGEKLSASIYQFCMDSRNRLWVATSIGLLQKDSGKQTFRIVKPVNGTIERAFAVTEDKEGTIWIGTDKGLKRVEWEGTQIFLKGSYEKDYGLEEGSVKAIYLNNYNQLYASYPNVVVRIDGRKKEKLDAIYTLQNGLISGHANCMVDDQMGNTWFGSNAGILTTRNGLDSFYYYLFTGDCTDVERLRDGRLLWANSWGLVFFDPAIVKTNANKQKLILTEIEVNNERMPMGEKKNKLVFNAENNDFHLYFSDLQYGTMQRKIAYRLLPENKEWQIQPLAEGIWYKRLPAGNYTLEAKLVFPDAKEGDVFQIPVTIQAAWYHSRWAYLAYILIVIVSTTVSYQYIKRKRLRKQAQREKEIIWREQVKQEQTKQEQKQKIEETRNRLLVWVLQDLRTPLSMIIAPLKELLETHSSLQTGKRQIQLAYRNSLRMLESCNQLLVVHGYGDSHNRIELTPLNVENLIDRGLQDIHELLKMYPIRLHIEKRIQKELMFYVDKKKIQFVIHNLLTNAFSHTHYAGTVSLSVCETIQNQIRYVTFIIRDDGKEKIKTFEEVMDEEKTQENDMYSIQLGFGFVQRIVEMHHGSVSLESTQDNGTKCTVNIPLDKTVFENDPNIRIIHPELPSETEENDIQPTLWSASEMSVLPSDTEEGQTVLHTCFISPKEEDAPDEGKEREPVTDISKKSLLIIENDQDIQLYLKNLLNKEYNLSMASNGQEGIDIAVKELPDLIICDSLVPGKDGFECCREIKERLETCHIPFLMLTAKVEDEDLIQVLEQGADGYLLKPFSPSILKAKIRNLINGRQALKQMYAQLFTLPENNETEFNEAEPLKEEIKIEDPFISTVVQIIEENIGEAEFNVKKLASEMNMSQPTLYRKVKQMTDYTIIEFIRGVRMRKAAALLKTKKYQVQEVAEMVGYNDIPTFRKHFVGAFGTTPSSYK